MIKRQLHDSSAYVITIEDNCPFQLQYNGCAADHKKSLKSVISIRVNTAGRLFTIFLVLWHRSEPWGSRDLRTDPRYDCWGFLHATVSPLQCASQVSPKQRL